MKLSQKSLYFQRVLNMLYTTTIPLPYYKKNSKALFTTNVVRNAHHQTEAKFKREYGLKCAHALSDVPISTYTKLTLSYELHLHLTRGKPIKADPMRGRVEKSLDLGNLLTYVDKTFSDVLTQLKILPDDSISHIPQIHYYYKTIPDDEPEGIAVALELT